MSFSTESSLDRGRGTLTVPRLLGAGAAAASLLGSAVAVAALTRTDATGAAFLAAVVVGLGVTFAPRWLMRATRGAPVARAAVDGARAVGRVLAVGVAVALAALAAVDLVALVGTEPDPAMTTAVYLWGAVAFTVAGLGVGVVFPGGWLLPGRARSGGVRFVWPALLLVGLALAYPGAYDLFVAVTAALPHQPGLGWDALALVALGALSAVGSALAAWLLPRPVMALDVDGRGRALVSRRGGARLVDIDGGETLGRFVEGGQLARMSPDGRLMALAGPGDEIAIRRTEDGALVRRLTGAPHGLAALAFDQSGRRLAAVGDPAWAALWDLAMPTTQAERLRNRVGYGRSVAFARKGAALMVASASGAVSELPLIADGEASGPRKLPVGAAGRCALTTDGSRLVCAAGTAPVWDRVVALDVRGAELTVQWGRSIGESARALAVGAGGRVAVASLDGSLEVFDASGSSIAAWRGLGAGVSTLAVDGPRVLVGGRWGVSCWDVEAGALSPLDGAPGRRPASAKEAAAG